MSTRDAGEATALLVVDVQNDVMDAAWQSTAVIEKIAGLVERARRESVPVVWVQHDDDGMPQGSPEWQIVEGLQPAEGEARVRKQHGDSFEGTDLEDVLDGLGVGRLVVAGAESDACIRSTIHGAFTRGYDTILVGDAHTSGDKTEWGAPSPEAVAAHMNLYWGFQSAPGKVAAVADAADVVLSS